MIKIIACGKLKEKWMKEGIAEYIKRIRPYDKIEVIEVQDEKAPETNSAAENEQVKIVEGQRLLKNVRDDEYLILLDLAGQDIDSVALANKIQDCYNHARSKITFVIGGSLEQIYRSFRILHNEPYHK